METRMRQRSGFTIVELLIALFLAGIVTSAALAIYATQNGQLLVRDDGSEIEANLRAVAVELTTQIRMAGYNVPEGISKLEGYDTNPDTIVVTFDSGTLENVRIENAMPQPTAALQCEGHDLTGVYEGDWLFIYDPNTETGEFFEVTQILYSSCRILHDTMPLSKAYPAGSRILKLNRFKYYVDRSDSLHPYLMLSAPGLGNQIYAANITDLNVQYVLESGAVANVFPEADMVREVVIDLAGLSDGTDHRSDTPYRTRDFVARARTRNLGSQDKG